METVCDTYYNMHTVLYAILSLKRITAYEADIILSFCMYYQLCECKSLLFGMEGNNCDLKRFEKWVVLFYA